MNIHVPKITLDHSRQAILTTTEKQSHSQIHHPVLVAHPDHHSEKRHGEGP